MKMNCASRFINPRSLHHLPFRQPHLEVLRLVKPIGVYLPVMIRVSEAVVEPQEQYCDQLIRFSS